MCEVWERRGWEGGRVGGECSGTLGTSTICTVHLISLHHSLLLSPHPLVRCWSREAGFRGFWKTHINVHCTNVVTNVVWGYWGILSVEKFGLREYIISLFCRRTTFKIQQTCTTEGSILYNRGACSQNPPTRQSTTPQTNHLFSRYTYAHCCLHQLCVCKEEET